MARRPVRDPARDSRGRPARLARDAAMKTTPSKEEAAMNTTHVPANGPAASSTRRRGRRNRSDTTTLWRGAVLTAIAAVLFPRLNAVLYEHQAFWQLDKEAAVLIPIVMIGTLVLFALVGGRAWRRDTGSNSPAKVGLACGILALAAEPGPARLADPAAAVRVRATLEGRVAAGEPRVARPHLGRVIADRDTAAGARPALGDDEAVDAAVADEERDVLVAKLGRAR